MVYTTGTVLTLLALTSLLTWGMTNGGILLPWLWKSRHVGGAVQAAFDAAALMLANLSCLAIIIILGVIWTPSPDPTIPHWVDVAISSLFFFGVLCISGALHIKRTLWMGSMGSFEVKRGGP